MFNPFGFKEDVFAAIETKPGIGIPAIAKSTGLTQGMVLVAVSVLLKSGHIENIRSGLKVRID